MNFVPYSINKGMLKNVLVPIDFNVESLNTLRFALTDLKHEKLNVILMYAEHLDTSISSLLFYSPIQRIKTLCNQKFKDGMQLIKNSHESSIHTLRIELFHGRNANAFINFYEANEIDCIYLPKTYDFKSGKNGFNPIPMIKSTNYLYKEVTWLTEGSNSNELNQLFK
jgi:hypothetical protein